MKVGEGMKDVRYENDTDVLEIFIRSSSLTIRPTHFLFDKGFVVSRVQKNVCVHVTSCSLLYRMTFLR